MEEKASRKYFIFNFYLFQSQYNTLFLLQLNKFIRDHETLEQLEEPVTIDHDNIAIVRFVHHQLIEMARDCLAKSQDRLKILLRELQLGVGEVSAARQVFKYFFP